MCPFCGTKNKAIQKKFKVKCVSCGREFKREKTYDEKFARQIKRRKKRYAGKVNPYERLPDPVSINPRSKPDTKICLYCSNEISGKFNICPLCGNKSESELEIKLIHPPEHQNVKIFVWRRDMGRCVECGSKENLEYDHIIPFAKGGSNTARNIQLLCEECNRHKSDNI